MLGLFAVHVPCLNRRLTHRRQTIFAQSEQSIERHKQRMYRHGSKLRVEYQDSRIINDRLQKGKINLQTIRPSVLLLSSMRWMYRRAHTVFMGTTWPTRGFERHLLAIVPKLLTMEVISLLRALWTKTMQSICYCRPVRPTPLWEWL